MVATEAYGFVVVHVHVQCMSIDTVHVTCTLHIHVYMYTCNSCGFVLYVCTVVHIQYQYCVFSCDALREHVYSCVEQCLAVLLGYGTCVVHLACPQRLPCGRWCNLAVWISV